MSETQTRGFVSGHMLPWMFVPLGALSSHSGCQSLKEFDGLICALLLQLNTYASRLKG